LTFAAQSYKRECPNTSNTSKATPAIALAIEEPAVPSSARTWPPRPGTCGILGGDPISQFSRFFEGPTNMSIPVHELEAEVLGLPPEERARLLERLIESFEPESRVRDAWIALSLKREADVHSGTAVLIPGTEAVARVRARIA
jgi:hypothetical protein